MKCFSDKLFGLPSKVSGVEVLSVIGVTGARGVLGRRIAASLAEQGGDIRRFEGDVTDREELRRWVTGLDRIVHCAAVVPVVRVKSDPYTAVETNVMGSLNMASIAELTKDRHVTYLSSSHVYGQKAGPIAEEDTTDPVSLYGLTKLQGEQWVRSLSPRHLAIRVFSFFASDQSDDFLVPSLAKRIDAAEHQASIELSGADAVRDLADADWIADVCSRLVLSDKVGVVNCGTGQGYAIGEVARRLATVMGREDIRWHSLDESATRGPNQLVADVSRMTEFLGEVPGFDLDLALSRFVTQRAGVLEGSRNAG